MKNQKKSSCIFCGSPQLYTISPTQYRCASCHKTWSHQKLTQEKALLEAFLDNISANKASQRLRLNYQTVKKRFEQYRVLLSFESQKLYHLSVQCDEFDEYYYLPTSKKKKNNVYLYDAIGVLGMLYGDKVHTLLLPDHFDSLKQNHADPAEKEAYAKFLQQHKIAYFKSFHSDLSRFWEFLETFLHRFKGIQKENFSAYLKEAEFKFNHPRDEQERILIQLIAKYEQKPYM